VYFIFILLFRVYISFYFIFKNSDYYKNYNIIPNENKEILQLKEELKQSKSTIDQLNNRINELNNKLKSENEINLNKIQSLQNEINQKNEELNIEKDKNKTLEDRVQKLNTELSDKLKEITNIFDLKEGLNKIMVEKEKELKELKLELSRYPIKLKEGEKLMTINFTTANRRIQNYSIICKNTDLFNNIEKRLYEDYEEYYDTENYFTVNGKKINNCKNLEENNIHNNDAIILNII